MLKMSKTTAAMTLALGANLFGMAAHAGPISFDLMHTLPECSYPGKAPTFCDSADKKRVAKAAGMEDAVRRMLDLATDPAQAKITIAYFSFSNNAVFEKLCEKGKAGIPIEGFFDSSEKAPEKFSLKLRECQGPSGNNVRTHFLGTKSPWRLHHNKFLVVDPGKGSPLRINFSSGNLSSSGLSIHFDHWVMMEAPRTSNVARQQLCVISSLRKAIDPQNTGTDAAKDDPNVYRQALNACFAKAKVLDTASKQGIEAAVAQERIAPLFSPDPSDSISQALIDHINRVVPGGKIYGAIQHFLHNGIASALKRAVKRGVSVSMLMDDDVVTGQSEVPGVSEFYNGVLTPSKSGIDIRFMQTNAGVMQMMHNKFLVLDGVDSKGKTRVFSGAGHFTTAAMMNNYENFAITQDEGLTAKYDELFRYMRKGSLTEQQAKH